MSFLGLSFGNSSAERPSETIKRHEKTIKRYEDTIKSCREWYEDEVHRINRENEKNLDTVKDQARREQRTAQQDFDESVEEIEHDADKRVEAAEAKVQSTELAVKKAVLDEREKHLESDKKLEVKIATLEGSVKSESARADAAEDMVEQIVALLNDEKDGHSDLVAKIMAKLPTVELSKFNINVEMPAPEVHVVNAGQNKGNEQKK